MSLRTGSRLGTYEIVAPLGAGGMGEVYRARDLRLGREIALKVLPADVSTNADRLARFEREARTVAGLNHPNIVTLFSVEDDGDIRFLTMELIEGESLAEALSPAGLPIPRVVDLGIALADALAAAHEKGIVHRDLKPANVMLTRDGRVKVLDFGLAKLPSADSPSELTTAATVTTPLSSAGQVVGTVPYMAPEQIRAEAVDARTDLFALGVLLYELTSGRRPFTGKTLADVSSAILRDTPAPLTSMRRGLPDGLDRLVGRCLAKSPRDRIQTAQDVSNELRHVRRELERGEAGLSAQGTNERVVSIAVLPFVNRSANVDDEYFSDGLADELLDVLAKVKGLRVAARASSFYFKGKDVPVAEIGRTLDVTALLDGSVRKVGNRVRISIQLVNVADGSHLWSETYDRTVDDIFAVQDDIAQSVVKELRVTLVGAKADAGARDGGGRSEEAVVRADPEVYDLYLRGRHQLNRRSDDSLHRAIDFFGAAIARDPLYALAELGLAEAHGLLGFHEFEPPAEAFPRARAAAIRALASNPRLGEAHAVLGYVALHHDRDWELAEREFVRGITLNPRHAASKLWYANLLMASGRFDEAFEEGHRALELDPLSIIHDLVMAWAHFLERRYDASARLLERAIELEPAFFQAHQWRGWTFWQMGRLTEAGESLEMAGRLAQHPPTALAARAMAAALGGRVEEHRELVKRLIELRGERYVSAFLIALAMITAGDENAAEPWILRAANERSPWINFMKVDPRVRGLVDRPPVRSILEDLGRGG